MRSLFALLCTAAALAACSSPSPTQTLGGPPDSAAPPGISSTTCRDFEAWRRQPSEVILNVCRQQMSDAMCRMCLDM